MGKIYYLDLKTLLETLEGQSCLLKREIPKSITRSQEAYVCTIVLAHGQVVSCTLVGKNGQQFNGLNLWSSLEKVQDWEVTVTSETRQYSPAPHLQQQKTQPLQYSPVPTPAQIPVSNPSSDNEIIPYIVMQDASTRISSWPQQERILANAVLLQIDGRRSIAEIRTLLPLGATRMEQTFRQLAQQGIVRFRRRGM
jgi:hypothetical protein